MVNPNFGKRRPKLPGVGRLENTFRTQFHNVSEAETLKNSKKGRRQEQKTSEDRTIVCLKRHSRGKQRKTENSIQDQEKQRNKPNDKRHNPSKTNKTEFVNSL